MILHTSTIGEGEPLVFLHSGLQTGKTDFEYQQDYFKEGCQIILPDLRGHGKSINQDLSDYFNDSAADLAETLEHLGIESAHIVGCSLGALAGLFFAKRNPEKIRSLVLSGIMPEQPENWKAMNKAEIKRQAELLQNEEAVNYFNSLHGEGWKQFIYMGKAENWYPFEETSDLSDLNMPVLYIVGEGNVHETNGAVIYPAQNEKIHVSVIPFAGHLVHAEQPELYSKVLDEFLKNTKKTS